MLHQSPCSLCICQGGAPSLLFHLLHTPGGSAGSEAPSPPLPSVKLVSPKRAVPPLPVQQRAASAQHASRSSSSPAALEPRQLQPSDIPRSAQPHAGGGHADGLLAADPQGLQHASAAFAQPLQGSAQAGGPSQPRLLQHWAGVGMPVPQLPYRRQQPAEPQTSCSAASAPARTPLQGTLSPDRQAAGLGRHPPAPALTFRVPHPASQPGPSSLAGRRSASQPSIPTGGQSATQPDGPPKQSQPACGAPTSEEPQHPGLDQVPGRQQMTRQRSPPRPGQRPDMGQISAIKAEVAAARPERPGSARSPAQVTVADWRPEEFESVQLMMANPTIVQSMAEQV